MEKIVGCLKLRQTTTKRGERLLRTVPRVEHVLGLNTEKTPIMPEFLGDLRIISASLRDNDAMSTQKTILTSEKIQQER